MGEKNDPHSPARSAHPPPHAADLESSGGGTGSSKASSCCTKSHPIKPKLTLYDGISTIISLMIGAGIFTNIGENQQFLRTPLGVILMMGVSGVLGLTGALCYAELGTMIPGSGGEAQYLAKAFGPLPVFIFNLTSILILKPGSVAILSDATAKYLLSMIGNIVWGSASVDEETNKATAAAGDWHPLVHRAVGVGCCMLVTLAASLSTKWSNRVQGVLTFGKLGALALVILAGLGYYLIFVDKGMTMNANFSYSFSEISFHPAHLVKSLSNGLWAFEGWNNLNIVAGDLSNPAVNLPLSIWISVGTVVTLYILTLLGYYAVLPADVICPPGGDPITTIGVDVGRKLFGAAGNILMPLLIASSTFSAALSSMVTSSEIIVLAARTHQIPSLFGNISETFGTAVWAYLMQGIIASAMVLIGSSDDLIMVYTVPTWFFYAACIIVLLWLRWTEPQLPRPYRVFLITPIMFLLACVLLLGASAFAKIIPFAISCAVPLLAVPVYYILDRIYGMDVDLVNFEGGQEKEEFTSQK